MVVRTGVGIARYMIEVALCAYNEAMHQKFACLCIRWKIETNKTLFYDLFWPVIQPQDGLERYNGLKGFYFW